MHSTTEELKEFRRESFRRGEIIDTLVHDLLGLRLLPVSALRDAIAAMIRRTGYEIDTGPNVKTEE